MPLKTKMPRVDPIPFAVLFVFLSSVASAQSKSFPIKLDTVHLPNSVQLHERVISGGLPVGEAAFKELSDLGVKTIVSVDGAIPDVESAKKFGLRYVHLPHGYDGIPEHRVKELAKAVRELQSPIYIHCHHGKHRSPAAAVVACVTAGLIEPSKAKSVLTLAGTNENYRGLFDSAEKARPLSEAILNKIEVEFPETAKVPPLAEAMVHIEHAHDHLVAIAEANWTSPPSHPDLHPAHTALMLQEHFTELLRTDEVKQWPEPILQMLRDSETDAKAIVSNLNSGEQPDSKTQKELKHFADRITANCKQCHQHFRDKPLSEKLAP